ncbi:alpha/beta hydrolase fold domain-containing protein [Flavobacterium rakeshii]|uniref:Alpha/beta hydrolase fold domain-containing protein n=1 Tax=Flavobacterium rakeshii TaxID=1038845 RepID=A0A6N8HA62_9FLAO|nr:alpha/beta hydrolase [Flavobacterium rakeshii]MUV02843.1 alpha/beta hydrolase fold domain-containing protein [Flavobacterium rakeshii]
MKTAFILLAAVFTINVTAQQVIPLYKDSIPNSIPSKNKEKTVDNGFLITQDVSVPSLTVFKPQKQSDKKTAVIICPGGGYAFLATGHEGKDVAEALNKMGVMAFMLKYRLPNDTIMKDRKIAPLQDAQRAIQLVRENAAQWNIDPNKIGIMGFSAGGHLAATASTQFEREVIANPKHTSLRPDFSILLYPVISFTDSLTHMGSRINLIGKNPSKELIEQYSNELQVTTKTPPAFLVHAADDGLVPIGNSIAYYQALIKNGVLSEMLLYPHGEHGFGMINRSTNDRWMDNLKNWMKSGNFL